MQTYTRRGRSCLEMIGGLVVLVIVVIGGVMYFSSNSAKQSSPSPTSNSEQQPVPPSPPNASSAREPASVVPSSPPEAAKPDPIAEANTKIVKLQAELSTAQAAVAKARSNADGVRDRVIESLEKDDAYSKLKQQADSLNAKLKAMRTYTGGLLDDDGKKMASDLIRAKGALAKMTSDALAGSEQLAAANGAVSQKQSAVTVIQSEIGDQEAAISRMQGKREAAAQEKYRQEHQVMSLEAVSAQALYALYAGNEVAGDTAVKDRWCIVSGTVENVGKDLLGTPYIAFASAPDTIFSVQTLFPKNAVASLVNIEPGQKISVAGIGTGKFGNVLIKQCRIVPYTEPGETRDVALRP